MSDQRPIAEQQQQAVSPRLPMMSAYLSQLATRLQPNLPVQLQPAVRQSVLGRLLMFELYLASDPTYRPLQQLSLSTGIPPIYFLFATTVFLLLVARQLYRASKRILMDVVAIAYPTMKTMEVLEAETDTGSKEVTIDNDENEERKRRLDSNVQWKAYWVLFAMHKMLDHLKLVTSFVPFFDTGRLLLLLWAQHPQSQGARALYQYVMRTVWLKRYHEGLISRFQSMVSTDTINASIGALSMSSPADSNQILSQVGTEFAARMFGGQSRGELDDSQNQDSSRPRESYSYSSSPFRAPWGLNNGAGDQYIPRVRPDVANLLGLGLAARATSPSKLPSNEEAGIDELPIPATD